MTAPYAHLLLVTKDQPQLSSLVEALRELALYGVTITTNLEQAEKLLNSRTFDMLLADVRLRAEGCNVAEFLGRIHSEVPVPVLVVGRPADMPDITHCLEEGATDYVLLPVNAALLKARVQPHLQKRRLQEQALTALDAFDEVEKLADDLRLFILPLGIALTTESDLERLFERVVVTAMDLCSADAGTLFLRTEDDRLAYQIMHVRSLGLAYGGPDGEPVPYGSLPLYDEEGDPDLVNVATFAAHEGITINIADVYNEESFDFSGTRLFDNRNKYQSISCLTVPMRIREVTGVLQLRNRLDPGTGQILAFGAYNQLVAESLASLAAVALHNRRLRQQEASLLRYKRELQIGREIQAGFFPETLPQPPGWELVAHFQSAREVAGDFYDAFPMPHGRIGLVIADVCDKGVVAALFMALLRSLLRALVQQHYALAAEEELAWQTDGEMTSEARPFAPADTSALLDTIRLMNAYIGSNHGHTHIFASLFFGILDPQSGRLIYVNCGHIPPILRRADGGIAYLMPTGPAIGLLSSAHYHVQEADLAPGDILLAYTDGLSEARDPQENMFGVEALLALITNQEGGTAADLLAAIEEAVEAHTAGREPFDDLAMLALRREQLT